MGKPARVLLVIMTLPATVVVLSRSSAAISIRHDQRAQLYADLAGNFPSVGYLADSQGLLCSGSLVATNKVLTAAHCLDSDADGQLDSPPGQLAFGVEANLPNSFTLNVASATVHSRWHASHGLATFDLATVTLANPVTTVALAAVSAADPVGLLATMVGYGNQGHGNLVPTELPGTDDRLAAQNMIDHFVIEEQVLQTDFDHPSAGDFFSTFGDFEPVELEGSTGMLDSGGPLWAQFSNTTAIVGVLAGGFNPFFPARYASEYGDISVWTPIATESNLAFLASQGVHPMDSISSGDYNRDGVVSTADFETWKTNFGSTTDLNADGNDNGRVDVGDYAVWRDQLATETAIEALFNLQTVPEPAADILCKGLALIVWLAASRHAHRHRI